MLNLLRGLLCELRGEAIFDARKGNLMICRTVGRDVLVLIVAFIASAALHAQEYPSRPVRVVSPYPPGSSADVMGRIFAPKMTEILGKQFVVENRPGASGNIAGELVARATPDGHTLLVLNTS